MRNKIFKEIILEHREVMSVSEAFSEKKAIEQLGDNLIQNIQKDVSPEIKELFGKVNWGKITPEQKQENLKKLFEFFKANVDPSADKQYTQFIVQNYARGVEWSWIEDLITKVRPALEKFSRLKSRNRISGPEKDISRYRDIVSFIDAMDKLEDIEEQKPKVEKKFNTIEEDERGKYSRLFENSEVLIVVPFNLKASQWWGANTTWCTVSSQYYFDNYTNNGKSKLYILLPKHPYTYETTTRDGKKITAAEKYQINFESNQFKDEKDIEVKDRLNLIKNKFGDLSPFFRKERPDLASKLAYADTNMINKLLNKMFELYSSQVDLGQDYEVVKQAVLNTIKKPPIMIQENADISYLVFAAGFQVRKNATNPIVKNESISWFLNNIEIQQIDSDTWDVSLSQSKGD